MDDAGIEPDVLGAELQYLARPQAWADASKQAQGEVRHEGAARVLLDVSHQLLRLFGAQSLCRAAPMGDPVISHLLDGVGRNPILLKRELKEG